MGRSRFSSLIGILICLMVATLVAMEIQRIQNESECAPVRIATPTR